MQFTQLNRDKTDKVFVSVVNVEGATITTGLPVAYVTVTSIDGASAVIANAAADYPGFIGFAVKDIPNNDIGLIQVGGFVNSILLSNVGTSITINAGDPLVPGPAGAFSGAPTYANSGFKFVIASNVPAHISAVGYASGILKLI